MHRVYSVYYYDKVGKSFNGNLLQRLLEYEYFANYKQKNIKSTSFQTLVILLHSLKVLTSKVHSKDLKKRIIFGCFAKFCQNYAGVTYPVVMSYFLNLEEALIFCCTGIVYNNKPALLQDLKNMTSPQGT